jgi:hypothetical protein
VIPPTYPTRQPHASANLAATSESWTVEGLASQFDSSKVTPDWGSARTLKTAQAAYRLLPVLMHEAARGASNDDFIVFDTVIILQVCQRSKGSDP